MCYQAIMKNINVLSVPVCWIFDKKLCEVAYEQMFPSYEKQMKSNVKFVLGHESRIPLFFVFRMTFFDNIGDYIEVWF